MHFVDEEDVALLQVGEDGGEVAGLLDHRSGRRADGHAELGRDDVGERRLAEARRAVEEDVVERLAALLRRGDRDLQVLAHAILADVVVERARAQPGLVLDVVIRPRRGHQTAIGHAPFIIDLSTSRNTRSKPASGDALRPRSMAFSAAAG